MLVIFINHNSYMKHSKAVQEWFKSPKSCLETIMVQYMFITPVLLKSEETGKVCVTLKKIDEPLDLNVVLQLNGQNTTIFSEDVPPPSFFQCNDITAPSAGDPTVGFIIFSAIGTNTKILDRKSVVVQSTENHYFFQMDKPLYKQGQKGEGNKD
ncbi:Hypothetical predicted protein [Pelobates cultripes]|uniref:Uncharacterized protein n=1 Tax=Pelobates cultripes TaxID=61616 RepID=A0AAD1WUZ9_PELCU|nr:Hypothetical predicted protein [Pelobates cultripes]